MMRKKEVRRVTKVQEVNRIELDDHNAYSKKSIVLQGKNPIEVVENNQYR
jgi:hypothetical protein